VISWLAEWPARRPVVLTALGVFAVAVAVILTWPVTDLIAAHDVGTINGPLRALHLQSAREAVRTQLLTLGAGVFAAGALVYTARNYTLTRRTVELTEQGQVTDRYTKAIEQLGSDKVDVRIGGIYALERIARDSARDHKTVMEVLTAFIREHSREQWQQPSDTAETRNGATRPDVQAALTVVGRRNSQNDDPREIPVLNLRGAYLRGALLIEANLSRADLTRADLSGANLYSAKLIEARLDDAQLADAYLLGAHLAGADFSGADLTGAFWTWDAEIPEGWLLHGESNRLQRVTESSADATPH
jgi:Pentapeptide repeats (8 copies)